MLTKSKLCCSLEADLETDKCNHGLDLYLKLYGLVLPLSLLVW